MTSSFFARASFLAYSLFSSSDNALAEIGCLQYALSNTHNDAEFPTGSPSHVKLEAEALPDSKARATWDSGGSVQPRNNPAYVYSFEARISGFLS